MKFTVQPQNLASAYKAVKSVLGTKTAMPVLENVLLRPRDAESVTLTASDGDNTITVAMQIEGSEDMIPFLIPSSYLASYIGNIGTTPIDVEVTAEGEMILSDWLGDFHFMGNTNVAEYPSAKALTDTLQCSVDAAALIERTAAAMKYTADDNLRPVMQGVYFHFLPDGLHLASSNSKILFTDLIPGVSVECDDETGVIVNSRVVSAFVSVFSPLGEPITIIFDKTSIVMRQGDVEIRGRLIEGKFPRYGSVIPRNNDKTAVVDRAAFVAGIKRVAMSANKADPRITMQFDGNSGYKLDAQDIDFSLSASVKGTTTAQDASLTDFIVGFNYIYLLELISTFPKDTTSLTLLFSEPSRAALVKREKNDERITLILPMLVNK